MRYVWIALFALLLLFLAAGPRLFLERAPADERLAIISPHWEGIQQEFERAFAAHYLKRFGARIEIDWVDVGGTGNIRRFLDLRFGKAGPDEGVGIDVLFGGGVDIFPQFADKNFFEAVPLPPEIAAGLELALPGGLPLRDAQGRYYAGCLSSFGFVYNRLVLERAQLLPPPQTWEDLGLPKFSGWISCGDPSASGSLHQAFELVLQGYGWQRGYTVLTRMLSNVRATNEGGTSIPRDVSLGQAAAGPCIDFYASAPARRQGATHLQLVVPKGVTVVTPDSMGVLRHPPNGRAAREFLYFVLSEEGQRLWYQARDPEGATPGAPIDFDLERLPLRKDIYERGYKTFTVLNPFTTVADFKYDSSKGGRRWWIMDDVWRAFILDVQDSLWDARRAVVKAGREADLGVALCQPPLGEDEVLNIAARRLPADQRNVLKNKWSGWARRWYAAVRQAAEHNAPVPTFSPAPTQ